MCISFHAINVTIFNTYFPIQHPLPLSTPTSLFCIHFPIQHPLPYSASTSTFNTHSPIQHPLSPSAPSSTPPFNSHKFHVLQPPVTASFRFFPRTVILATRHFPIKNCLFILPIWFLSPFTIPLHFLRPFFLTSGQLFVFRSSTDSSPRRFQPAIFQLFFILFSLEKFFKTGNFFLFVSSKVYLFRKLFSDAKI